MRIDFRGRQSPVARQAQLVCQHLENLSRDALEKYQDIVPVTSEAGRESRAYVMVRQVSEVNEAVIRGGGVSVEKDN
jgi:hypothetical protein